MPDDLRTRIATVTDAHTAMGYDSDYGPNDSWVCNCGWAWTAGGTHGEHVADAVIAALNLNTPVEYPSSDGKRRNFMVAGHYAVEVGE